MKPAELSLAGAVACVIGGLGTIGAAIGDALREQGATIVVADLDAVNRCDHPYDEAVELDVRDEAACERVVARVAERYGALDVLVNCAGTNRRQPLEHTSEDDWSTVLDVNLGGVWRVSRAAHRLLVNSSRAAIVNIGSTFGLRPQLSNGAYSVSKAGVHHLTRAMAVEWATDGIRVNAVCPTIVASEMTAEFRADADKLAALLGRIPLGRMAEPQDVAAAVAFLASPRASMITGQCLFVDGGLTAA